MASGPEGHGPMYVSPRSADVILSDIRPITFKIEALQCLNALLDELLSGILSVARSLNTERLKLALMKVLPTALGKEALLEAEVELRAYFERTNTPRPGSAHGKVPADSDFNVQWAFALMRLKCEAYSTLNDSDEDAQAESRINDSLGHPGMKASLVAPAALYLTAILEAICEHVLSNVGRVATRDSSSTVAGLQDLFVALCEDDSIYSLFRTMKVYEHIEFLTKRPTSRRSKSISRNDRRDTPSPLPDVVSLKESAGAPSTRSRISSESSLPNAVLISTASRPSLEKARAIKLFKAHNRTSSDREIPLPDMPTTVRKPEAAEPGRRSISGQSDGVGNGYEFDEDDQEFDDLMRSGDTMKMSLTPDRLRTMEVYNRERTQRAARQGVPQNGSASGSAPAPVAPAPSGLPSPEPTPHPHHHMGTRPVLRHVDSIIEDDEESKEAHGSSLPATPANHRSPTYSTSSMSGPPPTASAARLRSLSHSATFQQNGRQAGRKTSFGSQAPPMPPPVTIPSRDHRIMSKPMDNPGLPKRQRKIQGRRESMDLDDIMNGSDDDDNSLAPAPETPGPKRQTPYPVSRATRDLLEFLSEGPPPEVQPVRPAAMSTVSLTPTTKSGKSGGRLQRMISKLSLTNDKGSPDSPRLLRKSSVTAMSAPNTPATLVAAPLPIPPRPVPPRYNYPPPISPPTSPSRDPSPDDVLMSADSVRERRKGVVRKAPPNWEAQREPIPPATPAKDRMTPSPRPAPSPAPPSPVPPVSAPANGNVSANGNGAPYMNGSVRTAQKQEVYPRQTGSPQPHAQPRPGRLEKEDPRPASGGSGGAMTKADASPQGAARASTNGNGNGNVVNGERVSRRSNKRKSTLNPLDSVDRSPSQTPPAPSLSEAMAVDMRRLMSKATNADECRLLVDMFFAKAGLPIPSDTRTPSPDRVALKDIQLPSPPPTATGHALEHSLVEHFLGEDTPVPDTVIPVEKEVSTSRTNTIASFEDKGTANERVEDRHPQPVDTHTPPQTGIPA
ncbi:hypothetical protein DENSPDRAFT_831626 [Dentipellis sp. KUC8613]|nr:hypothetical protein DENSPDRAFT_831626 [Dentipellis sp. KUC8613]